MENSSDYIQKIIDEINDHLLHPEKTKVHLKTFGFYNSLDKLIDHCSKNPNDTKISLQLNELWYVVEDLHNGIVFRRYLRPDENGYLWEYEVDPDDQKILNSKKLGKYELSRDDKIRLETIEREEERINNKRKKLGIAEPFKTHGIHIGDFTKRQKYNIHSRLDSFMIHEKWAYDRRDSFCQNITTIYQRFENLRLPRTAHLKYEDYVAKIASSAYTLPNPDKQPMNLKSISSNENTNSNKSRKNIQKGIGIAIEPITLFEISKLNDFEKRILKLLHEDKYIDNQNKWIYEKGGKLCFIPLRSLIKWMSENSYFKNVNKSRFYTELKKYLEGIFSVDLRENLQKAKINKANSAIFCSYDCRK